MSRWIPPLLASFVGIALGLIYGWVIDPVEFVDTTPDTLRSDYRADYVLMVAEAYQADNDLDAAARRLAAWNSQPPAELAADALESARGYGFAEPDIALMQKLATALLAWQPPDEETTP